jgi:hypothetical protein
MSEGNKESFCPLLWRANGGLIDDKGRPISPNHRGKPAVVSDDEVDLEEEMAQQAAAAQRPYEKRYVRGMCTRPHDCIECPLMRQELSFHPPDTVNWVCPDCISALYAAKKAGGTPITTPGFFTEGICTYSKCTRPPREEDAEGLPGIPSGETATTPPGFSRFLQLVLGPINQ